MNNKWIYTLIIFLISAITTYDVIVNTGEYFFLGSVYVVMFILVYYFHSRIER